MSGRRTIRGRLLALVSLTVLVAGCATAASTQPVVTGSPGSTSGSPTASQGGRPLIVDTDMGADDIMAILYLLRDPEVDVRAIVVSGTGLAHASYGAQNVSDLLGAMGRDDVPIAMGSDTPMDGDRAFPADWRTGTDSAYGLQLPRIPMSPVSAAELIASTIRASASPVSFLTLGPLTDLGEALTADPTLASRIAQVHVSGGAIDVPGNVAAEGGDAAATAAEWNLWIDPKADDVVLRAGIPVTLVPLDATAKLPLTSAFTDKLAQDHASAGADIVYELLTRSQSLLSGNSFWDQLAAVTLVVPEAGTFAEARIRVATQGAAAGSVTRDPNGIAVRYATAPDAAHFDASFLAGLRRGAQRAKPFTVTGTLAVRFDGATCSGSPSSAIARGTYAIDAEVSVPGDNGIGLIRLHSGATWQDLSRYVADKSHDQLTPPDFVDVAAIANSSRPGITRVVADRAPGLYGFVCLSASGTPVAILAPAPFNVGG